MLFLSYFCYPFVHLCLLLPCGHLLGKADFLALVCDDSLCSFHFPICILNQVWCLIVSIPNVHKIEYSRLLLVKIYMSAVTQKGCLR